MSGYMLPLVPVFLVVSAGLVWYALDFWWRDMRMEAVLGGVLALCSLGLGALVAGAAIWGPQ